MGYRGGVLVLTGLSGALMACDSYNSAGPGGDLVVEPISEVAATGDLTARLTDFRATVGDPANGGGAGPQPGGRRGIRWDGIPGEHVNMATGSTRMTLEFRVPGSQQTGLVNGIGIVFLDVDRERAASIEAFTADGESLGRYFAPPRSDAAGHSFIGVVYDRPIIARVEVISGEAALAPGRNDLSLGGAGDLVVTDDFIYGEPQPAAATVALAR